MGILAAAFAVTGAGGASSTRLRVTPVESGVVVQVLAGSGQTVEFRLGGRPLARRSKPPYAILVRGHRPAGSGGRSAVWLAARDVRTGRTLARIRLAPMPLRAALPTPPSRYAAPAGAVRVSTSAGLRAALARERVRDIVLADGVYDDDKPFLNAAGHRVYAARLGGAVLRAGFVLGHSRGAGNGLLRGLRFDVSDPTKTAHGDIVHVWGTGRGTRLLDLTLDGHRALRSGLMVREPEGVVIQRVVARNFVDWGVNVDANDVNRIVERPPLVEDVVATDVSRVVPQSSGGSSEACVWIGNTAVVRRVFAARCAWEGVWTGTAARGAVLEDVRVVESETGVYAEHFNSAGTTFRRLDIGPSVKRGLNCEWSDPAWNSVAACIDVVVEDSLFDTTLIGVYLDEGTTRTTIRRSVFRNQEWAAIADHKGVANSYYQNDFAGLQRGAAPLSHDHLSQHWP